MKTIFRIISIIPILFLCGCLNFFTSSSSSGSNEIDSKYFGTYEGTITTIHNDQTSYQSTATVTVSSGSVISVNIYGYISFYNNIYKDNLVKVSDTLYTASFSSRGYIYNFTFAFSQSAMNLQFTRSDNTVSSGTLTKVR
ncbi:hypothetical protein [Brachyspira pulli]|uniref:hypothetical protein n=1 Tax=Brachyspira pulli TaxID=310721 RepID=UPI0030050602